MILCPSHKAKAGVRMFVGPKPCARNPRPDFLLSSCTDGGTELALQNSQSFSRCSLDSTNPPVITAVGRTLGLRELPQLRGLLLEPLRLAPIQSLPGSWLGSPALRQKGSGGPTWLSLPMPLVCARPLTRGCDQPCLLTPTWGSPGPQGEAM